MLDRLDREACSNRNPNPTITLRYLTMALSVAGASDILKEDYKPVIREQLNNTFFILETATQNSDDVQGIEAQLSAANQQVLLDHSFAAQILLALALKLSETASLRDTPAETLRAHAPLETSTPQGACPARVASNC